MQIKHVCVECDGTGIVAKIDPYSPETEKPCPYCQGVGYLTTDIIGDDLTNIMAKCEEIKNQAESDAGGHQLHQSKGGIGGNMPILCWACTEQYDDSLAKCPFCGVPRDAPKREPVKVVEKKPVVKAPVKKPSGRK